MSEYVTAEQVAEALGIHKSSVIRRADREKWPHVSRKSRGGKRFDYRISMLDDDVKMPVLALLAKRDAVTAAAEAAGKAHAARQKIVTALDVRAAEAARQSGMAKFFRLPEGGQRRAEARAAIVDMAAAYLKSSGFPQRRGTEIFCAEYSGGRIEAPGWVREAIQSVSANSIVNWRTQLKAEGLARLAGKHGEHRKGSGVIDSNPELAGFVRSMLHDFPHASAESVMRGIRARFTAEAQPSYRTLQRWLAAWKSEHAQLFSAITSPDAWRSKYMAAGGKADAKIVRLNQRWETDSTKGDLLLSDGKRHVIVGIIDVYSRRLKYHVSRSSSSAAVASTLRRALTDWGVPEVLGTDNGSDYVSQHVVRITAGLGIERDVAPPFTPDHKPFIERSFGTFCRDLVELLPGYVGHDVADRKAIESRRSFAQRLMKQGGEAIELRMSPDELQSFCDQWTDNVYGVEAHGGLNGRSPFEVAASWREPVRRIGDERALDVLLCPAPGGDGIRTITKKGIKLDGGWFEAPALGGLEGQDVRILLDEADIGEIFVFDLDGIFLAKAICPERAGISRQELSAARKANQRRAMSEQKAALKADAKKHNTRNIVPEILRAKAIEAGQMIAFPAPSVTHTTPDLDEAAIAARSRDAAIPQPISERERAFQARIVAELNPTRTAEVVTLETGGTRFARALDIERATTAGLTVDDEDQRWLSVYRNTAEFKSRKKFAEDFGEEVALEA